MKNTGIGGDTFVRTDKGLQKIRWVCGALTPNKVMPTTELVESIRDLESGGDSPFHGLQECIRLNLEHGFSVVAAPDTLFLTRRGDEVLLASPTHIAVGDEMITQFSSKFICERKKKKSAVLKMSFPQHITLSYEDVQPLLDEWVNPSEFKAFLEKFYDSMYEQRVFSFFRAHFRDLPKMVVSSLKAAKNIPELYGVVRKYQSAFLESLSQERYDDMLRPLPYHYVASRVQEFLTYKGSPIHTTGVGIARFLQDYAATYGYLLSRVGNSLTYIPNVKPSSLKVLSKDYVVDLSYDLLASCYMAGSVFVCDESYAYERFT